MFSNDDYAVADRRNCRVQIFRADNTLRNVFHTRSQPVYIDCDSDFNLIVSTEKFVLEVYDLRSKQKAEFCFDYPEDVALIGYPVMAMSSGKVVLLEPSQNAVNVFTLDGSYFKKFTLEPMCPGMAVTVGGITLDWNGNIVVVDTLNHSIISYSETGEVLQGILYPPDTLGAAQCCTISPEGHLIVAEYCVNAPHAVKIFRYGPCKCHRTRKGKRHTYTVNSKPMTSLGKHDPEESRKFWHGIWQSPYPKQN